MKMNKFIDWVIPLMFIIFVFILGIFIGDSHSNKKLREENAELQIEIAEYRITERWFEDYLDLIEEIHNGEIDLYKEKLKQYDDLTAPIIDDFEQVIDLCCYYYEETDRLVSFGDWLQINYPALYSRLLNYF